MTERDLRPLLNSRWGFESNCFVCEQSNAAGLRVPFFHDVDAPEVTGEFELDERFSGAPNYVHGGVLLAILDEAMAWATIAVTGTFAVTKETSARFLRPVRVGRGYRVTAKVVSEGEELACEAAITDEAGKERVVAAATFVPLGPAQAIDAIGTELSSDDGAYVRGDP